MSVHPTGNPPPYNGYSQPPPTIAQPITQQPINNSSNQTVVINTSGMAPNSGGGMPQNQRDWSSGLLGCFDDCGIALMAWFCPCAYAYSLSDKMGEGCCLPFCCPGPATLLPLRVKMRSQYGIKGSILNDYCAVYCCEPCVMCQLGRELKYVHGY